MHRYKQVKHVLGSRGEIMIVAADPAAVDDIFDAIWRAIHAFESRFSRFRVDSELTTCNEHAGDWTQVSLEFVQLVQECIHFNSVTDGLFNPFVLPALQRAGYRGSWPHPAKADERLDVRHKRVADMRHLELKADHIRIPHDAALDFGGIGKGFALDMVADLLQKFGCDNYCVSLGGDVICNGNDETDKAWRIGISNAQSQRTAIGYVTNIDGRRLAVASSSVVKRSGAGWHHLIDPRTHHPSTSDSLMTTVLTHTGIAADVFAKSLVIDPSVILPKDELIATCTQHKDGSVTVSQANEYIHLTQNVHYIR